MIACPTCGFKNHEGALFCEACGVYFHTGGALATNALPVESGSKPGPSGFPAASAGPAGASTRLTLISPADGRRFAIASEPSTTLLGRSDRKARLFVDVDLAGEDGQAFGVSRRHARMHFSNGHFLLEDLESLNGTYLNGRKLRPYLPEVLHDSDEIKLGSLVLKVSLEEKQP